MTKDNNQTSDSMQSKTSFKTPLQQLVDAVAKLPPRAKHFGSNDWKAALDKAVPDWKSVVCDPANWSVLLAQCAPRRSRDGLMECFVEEVGLKLANEWIASSVGSAANAAGGWLEAHPGQFISFSVAAKDAFCKYNGLDFLLNQLTPDIWQHLGQEQRERILELPWIFMRQRLMWRIQFAFMLYVKGFSAAETQAVIDDTEDRCDSSHFETAIYRYDDVFHYHFRHWQEPCQAQPPAARAVALRSPFYLPQCNLPIDPRAVALLNILNQLGDTGSLTIWDKHRQEFDAWRSVFPAALTPSGSIGAGGITLTTRSIDYSAPYKGLANLTYNPFDDKAFPIPGAPYFQGSSGPAIRVTRWVAFNDLDKPSCTFHITPKDVAAGNPAVYGNPVICKAGGKIDVKKGQPFIIPSADSNNRFGSLNVPAGMTYSVQRDAADNFSLGLDGDYQGPLEYVVETDGPPSKNAFIDDFAQFKGQIPQLPSIRLLGQLLPIPIPGLNLQGRPTIGEFIDKVQAYFSGYSVTDADINSLEQCPDYNARMQFMLTHKVGSCRHRAFLGCQLFAEAGIETRYVLNSIHAWIECFIEGKWRYIDLGGAPISFNSPEYAANGEIRNKHDKLICSPACGDFPFCSQQGRARPGVPCDTIRADEVVARRRNNR